MSGLLGADVAGERWGERTVQPAPEGANGLAAVPELVDGLRVYSVSELTRVIKELLEGDPRLARVYVKGEISNFKHHSSGHMYFTLKDERSRLKCVMFRARNQELRFRPEDGLTVVAGGTIGVYEVSGEYQLYVEELFPAGLGALWLAFEQLKQKLAAEGLFSPERKRPLPRMPRAVGVVTSPTGAAIRDILSVLRRRWPGVRVVLAPALVQGEGSAESVVAAIQRLNRFGEVDVLIVGRGGGSIEELWTFNDERVARAIAASNIPVISAVGHETDVTIADFVADRRAPTPSAAAEMAVPDRAALREQVLALQQRGLLAIRKRLQAARQRLAYVQRSSALNRPFAQLNRYRQQVDELMHRAQLACRHTLDRRRRDLQALAGKLDSLSPLATMARGYAICRDPNSGAVIRSVQEVRTGQTVGVLLQDGELLCRVQRRHGGPNPVQPSLPFA